MLNKKFQALLLALCLFTAEAAYAGPSAGFEPEKNFVTDSFDAAISGSEVVFPYQHNKIYKIYAQKGYITDIRMQPGETISSVTAGDTSRWVIDKAKVGKGRAAVEHLYIKPKYSGITTNMFINTTQRSYQLTLVSGNFYNPGVSWTVERKMASGLSEDLSENYLAFDPETLNFSYSFNNKELAWAPKNVFDDGKKTYIKMKPEVFSSTMPAFFVLNKKDKPVLVNYRILKGTYIIDRIFDKAALVVGREKVTLKRSKKHG